MTDRPADARPAGDRRARGALAVIWVAAAMFLALLALLAARVATGHDPALRARAAATPWPARRVLVRRIYERRVIVHLPPTAPAQPTRASQQVSSASGLAPSPLVTRTS
jgi:hypothetical protein